MGIASRAGKAKTPRRPFLCTSSGFNEENKGRSAADAPGEETENHRFCLHLIMTDERLAGDSGTGSEENKTDNSI